MLFTSSWVLERDGLDAYDIKTAFVFARASAESTLGGKEVRRIALMHQAVCLGLIVGSTLLFTYHFLTVLNCAGVCRSWGMSNVVSGHTSSGYLSKTSSPSLDTVPPWTVVQATESTA